MAKKIELTVAYCGECKHCARKLNDGYVTYFCKELSKTLQPLSMIPDSNTIPDWCPLPDAEDEDEA